MAHNIQIGLEGKISSSPTKQYKMIYHVSPTELKQQQESAARTADRIQASMAITFKSSATPAVEGASSAIGHAVPVITKADSDKSTTTLGKHPRSTSPSSGGCVAKRGKLGNTDAGSQGDDSEFDEDSCRRNWLALQDIPRLELHSFTVCEAD